MKTYISKSAALVLTLAALTLGACSTMPESHKTDMQTHEMGTPGKTHSMANSAMPER